jgi:hypothetical protein
MSDWQDTWDRDADTCIRRAIDEIEADPERAAKWSEFLVQAKKVLRKSRMATKFVPPKTRAEILTMAPESLTLRIAWVGWEYPTLTDIYLSVVDLMPGANRPQFTVHVVFKDTVELSEHRVERLLFRPIVCFFPDDRLRNVGFTLGTKKPSVPCIQIFEHEVSR